MVQLTSTLLVASLAAGSMAASIHQRHADFHQKRTPAAAPADQMLEALQARALDSEPGLEKRCGEMITANYNGETFSFPNNFGACAGSQSAPAAAPAPAAPAPAAPEAPAPAAPASTPVPVAQNIAQQVPASSAAKASAAAPSASAAPASSASSAGSASVGGGKKGLAYNKLSGLTSAWIRNGVSWCYNWDSSYAKVPQGLTFIPTLHDAGAVASFADKAKAFPSGVPIFSFNEPDMPVAYGGADMAPGAAATAHAATLSPLSKAGHPISAPSVSSSGAKGQGLDWLAQFKTACNGGCAVDFMNLHWYGGGGSGAVQFAAFKSYFDAAIPKSLALFPSAKGVWITEFAPTPIAPAIDPAVLRDFMALVVPYLEAKTEVLGYAPFMVDVLGGGAPVSALTSNFL